MTPDQQALVAKVAAKDARYAVGSKSAVRTPQPKPAKSVPLPVVTPCVHEGPVVESCKTCNKERGELRHVRACMHPAPSDENRDTCTRTRVSPGQAPQVCGECPDRSPEPPPGWLLIPQPPALNLTPRSRLAVVTVAVGPKGRELLDASGPHMRRYAERVGADFVVLDWPGHPDWPMSSKFAIPRVLDHYDRIIYADADVLLRPGCVNLFEMCAPHEMGVVDELQHHRQQTQFGREQAYLRFRREMGFKDVPNLPWMFNAGVMVVPKSHQNLLMPPTRPMPKGHCAEQDHTNARLLDSGLPYRLLDRRCNWQNWTDHGFKSAPPDAVLHWSGAGRDRVARDEQIRQWATRHPWESPVVGVGMEKTGTRSLARMLGGRHEPDEDAAILAALGNGDRAAVASGVRDGDVSNLFVHMLPELAGRHPSARYVLAVREPLSWLRSSVAHGTRHAHEASEQWKRVDRLRKGDCDVEGCLKYWEWHNRAVLDAVPADRLLVVRTDDLGVSGDRLAEFAGRPVKPAREGVARYADPLAEHPAEWLADRARELCPSWPELERRSRLTPRGTRYFDLPEPVDPAWTVDDRHVRWMHRTLLSGRFRRALEIGCLHGRSTRAFLDALKAGAVDHVDLCDVAVTPELESLVAGSGVADRVTVHRTHSTDLLARSGPAWDLAFVDGDHTAATCEAETRLLLGMGVRAVFAHDTAAAGRFPRCEGPALLADAFRRAGYLCTEDATARPGERTDRGMFFAARTPEDFAAGRALIASAQPHSPEGRGDPR